MKRAVTIILICVTAMSAGPVFGQTRTYAFVGEQSTVLQTGGIAGVNIRHQVEGRFQLTVDADAGTARFDWVDATLSESGFLPTRSLGLLFRMTDLIGTFVDNTTIRFETVTDMTGVVDDINLELTLKFKGWGVELTGGFCEPVIDGFCFDLTAAAVEEAAGWTYHYYDDFSTNQAEKDSISHSVFWPGEAFPPDESHLYYTGEGPARSLAFADFQGQPAHLAYCFPVGAPPIRAVKGTIEIDVCHAACDPAMAPRRPGYLLYSLSSDGVNWSIPKPLGAGHHEIPVQSVQGTVYFVLLGTRVMIDNLRVHLQSSPATIHVPGDFGTIQAAIDFAGDGDVVEVAPGLYKGAGNWDIDFLGKAITVRSAAGPEETIIDCGGSGSGAGRWHRGFYFRRGEGAHSVLRGFTIRGGRVSGSELPRTSTSNAWDINAVVPVPVGGGICTLFSSPTIVNCVVTGCGAELGGGIGCVGGAPAIVNCRIENCTAGGFGPAESGGRGGGIGLMWTAGAKVTDCLVRNNTAYYNGAGAGLYCYDAKATITGCEISSNEGRSGAIAGGAYCAGRSARVVFKNCVVSNNVAGAGAAFYVDADLEGRGAEPLPAEPAGDGPMWHPCFVRVTNCTVAHNRLSQPQMPPFPGGGIHSLGADIIVKNSIVWHNEGTPVFIQGPASRSPVIYSDIEGGHLGQGNIDKEPLFAPTGVPDYHLQSIYGRYDPRLSKWVVDINHSPCIDAGDPRDPVGQEPFPNGKRINMGAYGGTRHASKGALHLVYHVDAARGDDSNNGLSRARAFATICKGVGEARDGDTVLVWPGVYREEVSFNGKAITVQSAADAAIVEAPTGWAFSFYSAEDRRSVLRNFVIRNCADAGVFCVVASPTLSNLTIVDNTFGIVAQEGADPNITNCILWDNVNGDLQGATARYSCIQQPSAQWIDDDDRGNFAAEPLFTDPIHGDYHLRSRFGRYWPEHRVWVIDKRTSPCIDAGDPKIAPNRERMPHGGRLNIGAYGGTPFASMSDWPLKGDVNRDGVVNMRDFAILAEQWLERMPWRWTPTAEPVDGIISPVDGSVIPVPALVLGDGGPGAQVGLQNGRP